MNAQKLLFTVVKKGLTNYTTSIPTHHLSAHQKEFEGDFTLVTFPFIKEAKKSPEQMGAEIRSLPSKERVCSKEFQCGERILNISLTDTFWLEYFISVKGN